MYAHTGVFGPAVRTNASRLGREVRNGGYPVWAICRLQAVLFYIFNRFDDIKLLVRRQPTEIGEKPTLLTALEGHWHEKMQEVRKSSMMKAIFWKLKKIRQEHFNL